MTHAEERVTGSSGGSRTSRNTSRTCGVVTASAASPVLTTVHEVLRDGSAPQREAGRAPGRGRLVPSGSMPQGWSSPAST
jgi:hypothetical protein